MSLGVRIYISKAELKVSRLPDIHTDGSLQDPSDIFIVELDLDKTSTTAAPYNFLYSDRHTNIMPQISQFNPPAANLPGKPFVPDWIPPPVTKETHNFAQLKSIDLSLLDSEDPAVVDQLVQSVKQAIREDGFLFLENYGISIEQVKALD